MKSRKIEAGTSEMLKIALVIMCAALMCGCGTSFLASRDTNPVIQDYATTNLISFDRAVVFATTASRRLAIVTEDKALGKVVTCAEPPPDVGEAFASAVAAGLKAAGEASLQTGEKISTEIATQYGRTVATQIAPLLNRTQGLQLYRDFSYKLCIDKMNNWIDIDQYNSQRSAILKETVSLIKEELPHIEKIAIAFYTNVRAGSTNTAATTAPDNSAIDKPPEIKKIEFTKSSISAATADTPIKLAINSKNDLKKLNVTKMSGPKGEIDKKSWPSITPDPKDSKKFELEFPAKTQPDKYTIVFSGNVSDGPPDIPGQIEVIITPNKNMPS